MAGGAKNKTITLKPIVIGRVRCAEKHKVVRKKKTEEITVFLKRLYVLWAPIDPTKAEDEQELKFHIAQTDMEGYLSPLLSDLDPDLQKPQPLAEDVEYYFYFVRHPDDALPREILKDVNEGKTDPWGEPQKIKVVREPPPGGKSKKGKDNKELMVAVPEQPEAFLPGGSEFYKKWVLFRDMPCAECAPVIEQVTRLQYHLGALRYPVGDHGHPYSPELAGFKNSNPGVFDVALWNGVLAFQRHLNEGLVNKESPALFTETLTAGSFDKRPDAAQVQRQLDVSMKYGANADKAAEKVDPLGTDYPTVVDAPTGDAIKTWLEKGFRKPGPLLLSPQTVDTYMSSAMLTAFDKWDAELKRLGFSHGIKVSNIFREPRIGVVTGGGGVSTSLHKSGFAMDLAFNGSKGSLDWGDPLPSYPLHFARDPSYKEAKGAKWLVYAEVPVDKVPADMKDASGKIVGAEHAVYHQTITPWKFDPYHADGGKELKPLTKPGSLFLEFTRLALHYGFTNIGAHKGDHLWKYRDELIEVLGPATLGKILTRFTVHLDPQRDPDLTPATTFHIAFQEVKFSEFAGEMRFLGKWARIMSRYAPAPEVRCDPATKEGQAMIKILRGSAKEFKGRKFLQDLGIPWEGVPYMPPQMEIDITAKTTFPPIPFTLRPITKPIDVQMGTIFEFPEYLGNAGHLEWWHFQYVAGYKGKFWRDLLGEIGWTEEGLLGPKGNKYIYGHWGIGYTPTDLAAPAT